MTAAAGPKYGCFIGMEKYRDVVVTEEERQANRENINRIVNQVMVRMGICVTLPLRPAMTPARSYRLAKSEYRYPG